MTGAFSHYIGLFGRLYTLFPRDRKTLSVPYPNKQFGNGDVKVVIDWSNIRIGYDHLQKQITRPSPPSKAKLLNLDILDVILVRGRCWNKKIVAGSFHRNDSEQLEKAKVKLHYTTHVLERQSIDHGTHTSQQEHGVDEILVSYIEDFVKNDKPGVIALATGDGQPFSTDSPKTGFYYSVEYALENQWRVEIYAFGDSASKNWEQLKRLFPNQIGIIYLNEFISYL